MNEINNQSTPAAKKTFETINAANLMKQEFEPLRFGIDKILPHGLFLFAGSGKIGKSWLALDMCVAVSSGGKLWDFPAEQGNVLYLALEDNKARLQGRLDTLATHITMYETRTQHRAVYNEYAKTKDPKKREAFYAKHGAEIEAFKEARDYLNAVMGDRTDPPPIKDWRKEHQSLTASKFALTERYYALQDEIRSVEQLPQGRGEYHA